VGWWRWGDEGGLGGWVVVVVVGERWCVGGGVAWWRGRWVAEGGGCEAVCKEPP